MEDGKRSCQDAEQSQNFPVGGVERSGWPKIRTTAYSYIYGVRSDAQVYCQSAVVAKGKLLSDVLVIVVI